MNYNNIKYQPFLSSEEFMICQVPNYDWTNIKQYHYHKWDTFIDGLDINHFATEVVTGPMRNLNLSIDAFNSDYIHFLNICDARTLKLTPKLMWSRGQYAEVEKVIDRFRQKHKKPRGMMSLFQRYEDGFHHMQSFKNNLKRIEDQRLLIRSKGLHNQSGYSRDEIIEMVEGFNNQLLSFVESVHKFSNGTIEINPSVNCSADGWNRTTVCIFIKFSNTTMRLFNRDAHLGDVHARPIYLSLSITFLDWFLEQMCIDRPIRRSDRSYKSYVGQGSYPYYGEKHPYINGEGRWDSLCLSDYQSDIVLNLVRLNPIEFVMKLKAWASVYNYHSTNPYWKPHFLFLGMPSQQKFMLDSNCEISGAKQNCESKMAQKFDKQDYTGDTYRVRVNLYDEVNKALAICHGINCLWKDSCNSHINFNIAITDRGKKISLLNEMIGLSNECQVLSQIFDNYDTLKDLYHRYLSYTYDNLVRYFYDILKEDGYYPLSAEQWKRRAGEFVSFEYYTNHVTKLARWKQRGDIGQGDFHYELKVADKKWKAYQKYLELLNINVQSERSESGQERINL